MAIGRLGKDSKMLFCGDSYQIDLKDKNYSALIPLLFARPKQNKTPSRILLFPEPLGPVTTVKPSSSGIDMDPPKDLK